MFYHHKSVYRIRAAPGSLRDVLVIVQISYVHTQRHESRVVLDCHGAMETIRKAWLSQGDLEKLLARASVDCQLVL
jgi:hypothetical protein